MYYNDYIYGDVCVCVSNTRAMISLLNGVFCCENPRSETYYYCSRSTLVIVFTAKSDGRCALVHCAAQWAGLSREGCLAHLATIKLLLPHLLKWVLKLQIHIEIIIVLIFIAY